MIYEEILPSIQLREYIKCFWILEESGKTQNHLPEPVLPDGRIELVFNLADSFKRFHFNGKEEIQPQTIIVGQTLQYTTIKPLGHIKLFGVRFQTAGASVFFEFPLNELTNKIESLELVLGAKGKRIDQRIKDAVSLQQRIEIIEDEILKSIILKNRFDVKIAKASKLIEAYDGLISIEELSKRVNMGSRHLERRFKQKVGLSPKSLCRINRIQKLMNLLKGEDFEKWIDLSMKFEYFDQSHFIRDFKMFTGKTPQIYLTENNQLTNVFLGI